MLSRLTMIAVVVISAVTFEVATAQEKPFVHPGILHTRGDLDRMKAMVSAGKQPWLSGFEKLQKHSQSRADWKMRGPFAEVVRDPRGSHRIVELEMDANAAYQNALMWCVTGKVAHARKAAEILNAWSSTLREINGKDRILGASLCGDKIANAAELLRYTYSDWSQADIRQCERLLRDVFLPVIKDFATFANGNWDTGCIKTMMAIGVFCNDRVTFDRAVEYFRNGEGNGRLTHYIINTTGQCQESGRDQQHTQLGLGHLAEACEIGWSQGLNLYAADNNRLLCGFEYTAKFNLSEDVPFVPFVDTTRKNKAKIISQEGRGALRAIYEMVWNHYEKRCNQSAPWTRQAAEKIRPEGEGFGADHPGFGTLLFTR